MFRERIEAVTTCVGYADFLAETAHWNAKHFDHWVVVTTPTDTDTREVCRKYRLQCLITEDNVRDGPFSKGRMIERGLQQLGFNSYIMHIDADIVLPGSFRQDLERAHIETDKIYGFDRFMVRGEAKWRKLVESGWPNLPSYGHPHAVVIPEGFPFGARWAGPDGWVPIGFAQLWHRKYGEEEWRGVRVKPYPIEHGSACRTDVQFSLQWDRRQRALIPELVVAHLESEGASNGINWNGRKSKPFGEAYTPQV